MSQPSFKMLQSHHWTPMSHLYTCLTTDKRQKSSYSYSFRRSQCANSSFLRSKRIQLLPHRSYGQFCPQSESRSRNIRQRRLIVHNLRKFVICRSFLVLLPLIMLISSIWIWRPHSSSLFQPRFPSTSVDKVYYGVSMSGWSHSGSSHIVAMICSKYSVEISAPHEHPLLRPFPDIFDSDHTTSQSFICSS